MHIGHINLSESFNGAGEHFVRLIESLRQHAFDQYVLVRNIDLAKRLDRSPPCLPCLTSGQHDAAKCGWPIIMAS